MVEEDGGEWMDPTTEEQEASIIIGGNKREKKRISKRDLGIIDLF